jgi:hypothetical protein
MYYTLLSKEYVTGSFYPDFKVYACDIYLNDVNTKINDIICSFFKKKKSYDVSFLVIENNMPGCSLKNYYNIILSNICVEFTLKWSARLKFITTFGNEELIHKTINAISIANKIINLDNYKKSIENKDRKHLHKIMLSHQIKNNNPFGDFHSCIVYAKLKHIITGNANLNFYADCPMQPLIY